METPPKWGPIYMGSSELCFLVVLRPPEGSKKWNLPIIPEVSQCSNEGHFGGVPCLDPLGGLGFLGWQNSNPRKKLRVTTWKSGGSNQVGFREITPWRRKWSMRWKLWLYRGLWGLPRHQYYGPRFLVYFWYTAPQINFNIW